MKERSTPFWIAALVATAVVAVGGTWLVVDRSADETIGDPVAAVDASTTLEPLSDDASTGAEGEDALKWLFSHTSDAGTLTESGDGTYELSFTGVDEHVTAFTDRPDRQSSILDIGAFVEAWPSMFAESAPNAVLVEHDPTGATDSLVVVLTNPRFDGSTLSFTAEIIADENHPSTVDGYVNAPHTEPPANFRDVSLFVDDVNLDTSVYSCVNAKGQVIQPPGSVSILTKPIAPFAALCGSVGGTVTATIVGDGEH